MRFLRNTALLIDEKITMKNLLVLLLPYSSFVDYGCVTGAAAAIL